MLISVHFQYFSLIFIIFMAIFGIEKMVMCSLFEGGRGSEKVYVLYTLESLDIFGWRLTATAPLTVPTHSR